MWQELGISSGTGVIIMIMLYFVVKWAVKNGVREAYEAIKNTATEEEMEAAEE